MNKIIAIVGMCGSGKSEVVNLLLQKGYEKVYFGGITLEEMQKQNIAITPQNEKNMREDLRKKYGMGAYAILSLPKIKDLRKSSNVVIDGLYSWDELKILKKEFNDDIITIAIISDKNIRYDRISKRNIRPLTKEEARERDLSEIENLAKGGPIAYADYFILNNKGLEELNLSLQQILDKQK